jgi:hypothetical protein
MSYDVSWLLENRVILTRFGQELADAELPAFNQVVVGYVERGAEPFVHHLVDCRQVEKLASIGAQRRDLKFPTLPKYGWTVFVGIRNPLVRMSLSIAPQLFKIRFRHVNTPEEGLAFLQYVDSTLPDLKPLKSKVETSPSTP